MQAAFVDIGLDKAAFLHASDIMPRIPSASPGEEQKQFTVRDISELVRQGQDLMVQVVKDPLGTKGARLTTDITLPSRYLVFMPGASHVGVSQRIESEAERERLKRSSQNIAMSRAVYHSHRCGRCSRAGDGCRCRFILSAYGPAKAQPDPLSAVWRAGSGLQRVLRDFADAQLDRIRVDSRLTAREALPNSPPNISENDQQAGTLQRPSADIRSRR